jgi:hypothetical protein
VFRPSVFLSHSDAEQEREAARQTALSTLRSWEAGEPGSRPALPTLAPREGIGIGASVHGPGVDFSLEEMNWVIPASRFAYDAIDKASAAFLEKLASLWVEMNKCGRAEACPQNKILAKRKREQNKAKCFFIGFCVCHKWRLREFVTRLQQFLRRSCPKGSFNQKYAKAGMLALRVYQPIVDGDTFWYHISYANLKTWVAALIPLVPTEDPIRSLVSRSAGRIALDLAEPGEARLGVHHWWRHLRDFEFSCQWHAQIYCLRDDDLAINVPFIPAELEVRSAVPTALAVIWNGQDESQPQPKRSADRRTSRRREAGSRAASSSAGPVHAASSSVGPVHTPSDTHSGAEGSDCAGSSARTGEQSEIDSLHSWQERHDEDLETEGTPGASSTGSVAPQEVAIDYISVFIEASYLSGCSFRLLYHHTHIFTHLLLFLCGCSCIGHLQVLRISYMSYAYVDMFVYVALPHRSKSTQRAQKAQEVLHQILKVQTMMPSQKAKARERREARKKETPSLKGKLLQSSIPCQCQPQLWLRMGLSIGAIS